MPPKPGLLLFLYHHTHHLAQKDKVGERAVVGPNAMGRFLREEVEVPVRKGLQAFPPHVAVDDLAYNGEAFVVHLPQHPVLQLVASRRCVAGALEYAAEAGDCSRGQP